MRDVDTTSTMLSPSFFLLTSTLFAAVTHQGFSSPSYVVSYGPGGFESNVVWYVGQSNEIAYDISGIDGLEGYTIALWQQSMAGASASQGPVVYSKLFVAYA